MRVGVVGAGSWGTAVANLLADKGLEVLLWCREEEVEVSIKEKRENELFLPGVRLSNNIEPTLEISDLRGVDFLVNAVPVQYIRSVWEDFVSPNVPVVNLSKGLEVRTKERVSQIFEDMGCSEYAVLSGPSFAKEVAVKKPTAVVVASEDPKISVFVRDVFAADYFRVYSHTDVVGVEIASALKNVMAIAAGISDGLGLGHNARASLINRGLFEMARFGIACGAKAETFWGLAGMGDLVLTCTGDLSRNRRLGLAIGRGATLKEALSSFRGVVEGVETVRAVVEMARDMEVEMPISEEVYRILFEGKEPRESVSDLLRRELKWETFPML